MATAETSTNSGINSGELLRAQVASCTRLLNMLGILHYSGHVSARVPGKDQLYIQTRNESRAEVSPDSIILVDFDGNVLEGEGKPPSELVIHTEVYRSRPDVGSVIHNHMELAAAITMAKDAKVHIMDFHASRWFSGVPVMTDVGHIKSTEDGVALANCLGDANGMLLRAHGVVLASESAPAILVDTIHFEDNLKAQKEARSFGDEIVPLTEAELARVGQYEDRDHHIEKMWNYYVNEGRKGGALPQDWDVRL
ncbi:MAG: class II aldolase/adducin family protein [Alphaproteobacteria bacterium]|jgi:L-ribulose-5-phosphate 4-epimerase